MRGQGAYLNQSIRLPLSHPHPLPLNSLGEALIGGEWGSDRSKAVRPTIEVLDCSDASYWRR